MYAIDPNGWLTSVKTLPSSHFDRGSEAPSLLVVHSASLPFASFGQGVLEKVFLGEMSPETDPWLGRYLSGRVSAHLLISRAGEVTQFVSLKDCAWHAGRSQYAGRTQCNQFSIGIELEGCDYLPYNDVQYIRLNALILAICDVYPIQAVVGHHQIAAGRKTDPGPLFDWTRVIRK